MKEEIAAAVLFISKLVQRGGHMPESYLGGFQQRLGQLLEQRFSNHWHPERPWRGQAYRCLRVNETQRREPTIEQAAKDCGLLYTDLKLPVELTIWVDPEEVCCRFGEAKGSCCVVASFKEGNKENYIENFDFSTVVVRPITSPSPTQKQIGDVLQDKTGECVNTSKVAMTATANINIMANNTSPLSTDSPTSPSSTSTSSPPSSTQSTPTKRKAFSPHNKTSPNHNKVHHNNNNKRNFGNIHHHNGYNNHHPHHHHPHHHHHHPPPHHHSNGSYSPPYYKSNHQSWVNLSQTPPPPPPHVPLFSSGSGFIYPPAAPPHYTTPHNAPPHHFTRSPPNVGGPQKLKWNAGSSYPRQDRHPWFSHRALARV